MYSLCLWFWLMVNAASSHTHSNTPMFVHRYAHTLTHKCALTHACTHTHSLICTLYFDQLRVKWDSKPWVRIPTFLKNCIPWHSCSREKYRVSWGRASADDMAFSEQWPCLAKRPRGHQHLTVRAPSSTPWISIQWQKVLQLKTQMS